MSYPSKTEFDNLRNSLPLTYQTRGNYAFRTDLASNINTALRNVNTALAAYAKKTDIPVVPANVATKTDLASYALASDLSKYQPAGRYVSPSELEAYQAKGEYALAKDLVSYAKSSDLANFQPKGEYALAADLASYAKESSLASYQPKGDYAVKSDLGNFQPKGDYALAADLTSYARQSSLASYQPKGDYALAKDLESYAVKSDLVGYQPKGSYALQTDLANYQVKGNYQTAGNYALQTDLANYQVKGNYQTAGNYAFQTDLASYQPRGNYQTAGNYALRTELANYALTKDFANLQPKGNYQTAGNYALQPTAGNYALQSELAGYQLKGNYQTAGNYALQPTAGNYALQSELAGYAKTAGASTFSGQVTFDKNAIVKTEGTTPFQVTGPGGLRVSGGNFTVTGDSTFGGKSTFTGDSTFSGNKLKLGNATFDAGTDDWVRMSANSGTSYNYGLAGKNLYADDQIMASGTSPTSGIQTPINALKINRHGIQFGGANNGKQLDSAQISAGIHVPDSLNIVGMSDAAGGNRKIDVWAEGGFTIRGDLKVTGGNLSASNADITNATIGNFNMTGAPTFNALATFEKNATVKTEGTPFQVTGSGGLRVTGGNSTFSNLATFEGGLKVGDGVSITSDTIKRDGGPLHISGDGLLYLLNKNGVVVGKDWGGNGNLSVGNTLTVGGNLRLDSETGITSFWPGHTLALDSSGIVGGSFIVKSNVTKGSTKVGINTESPTNNLDVVGGASISGSVGIGTTSPSYNLDVTGTGRFTSNLNVDGNLSTGNATITNLTVGNFNMTGVPSFSALATFTNNATVETQDGKPFQVNGAGGLRVSGGSLSANSFFLESGFDPALRLGPAIKDTGNARLNVQDKAGSYMRFFTGPTETGSITEDGGTSLNVNKVNAGQVSTGNAYITNLTVGNMKVTGAPTFSALATFENNATVKTTDSNPFKVTGAGGLQVDHTKLKLGNATFVAGTDDWVRMTDNAGTFDYGLAGKNLYADDQIFATGTSLTSGIQTPTNALKMNRHGIQFGGANNGKQLDSAQISAGIHVPDSLNIVGMSDAAGGNRKIDVWAEGGFTVYGEKLKVGGATFNAHPTDGWLRMSADGTTYNYGLAAKNLFADEGLAINNTGSDAHIRTPDSRLKMNQHGIQFGGKNKAGNETNSAQISAGLHVDHSLNIVGMTNGGDYNTRKIDTWAEGGFAIHGGGYTTLNLTKDGGLTLQNTTGGSAGIYMAQVANSFVENAIPGDMIIRNNKGTMRFTHAGVTAGSSFGSAMTINNKNIVSFPVGTRSDIETPNGELKINKMGIQFGGKNKAGYEINSAQISAGEHITDSLNIIGMSDSAGANRKVDIWAEGGLTVYGEKLKVGGATFHSHPTDTWVRMSADNGDSYNYGLAAKNLWTNGALNVGSTATVDGDLTVKGTIRADKILIGGRFLINWEAPTSSLLIMDTLGGNKGVYMRPSTNYWQTLN